MNPLITFVLISALFILPIFSGNSSDRREDLGEESSSKKINSKSQEDWEDLDLKVLPIAGPILALGKEVWYLSDDLLNKMGVSNPYLRTGISVTSLLIGIYGIRYFVEENPKDRETPNDKQDDQI